MIKAWFDISLVSAVKAIVQQTLRICFVLLSAWRHGRFLVVMQARFFQESAACGEGLRLRMANAPNTIKCLGRIAFQAAFQAAL